MNSLLYEINAASAAWWDALVRATWQGAIALSVVWLLSRGVAAIPAAHKAWLWRLAFAKLLVALVWLTPISLAVLPSKEPASVSLPSPALPEVQFEATAQTEPLSPPLTAAPVTIDGRIWLLAAWIAGLFWSTARVLRQWRAARTLVGESAPIADPVLNEILDRLGKALRLRRLPLMYRSDAVSSPLLIGIWRRRIILPATTLETNTPSQLEMMLAHELAHVRRRDLCWLWLFTCCETLFFFHPLVWLARREWAIATESACDQLALQITKREAHDYGSMLVGVVGRMRGRRPALATASIGMFETATTLKRRLKAMTKNPSRWSTVAGIALLVVVGLASVPYRLVAQAPDPETLARLKEENAKLKHELEATRAEIEALRRDAVATKQHGEALEQQRRAQESAKLADAAVRLRRAQAELEALLKKYTDQHPHVLAKRGELERLRRFLEQPIPNNPGAPEQRELLAREIELAEKQVQVVQKKLEVGKEVAESVLRVQREVLDLKLQQAELSGNKAEREAVLRAQLEIAERLLKEQQKRIEYGTLGSGEELAFEREVLRLKRELAKPYLPARKDAVGLSE